MLSNGIIATIQSYTHKELTVGILFTFKVINKIGKKITIMKALNETEFSKVHLMLGIHRTGWSYNDVFIGYYVRVTDEIRKVNPNCIIYAQSIILVAKKVSKTHQYVKNSKIRDFIPCFKKFLMKRCILYKCIRNFGK